MAIARARDVAAKASLLGQVIVGRSGGEPCYTLSLHGLLTSTGSHSSFETAWHPITQTSAAHTSLFPLVIMAPPAGGTLVDNERENSSIATEYSSVTLDHEQPDESESMDDIALGSDSSPLSTYEVTLGIGTVHLPICNPLDEYAGDGDIEKHQNKVAAMIAELTIEEEQKRLRVSTKEKPDQKQSNSIPGFAHLQESKDYPGRGWFLSTQSGHDNGAVEQRTLASREKSDVGNRHDFEVINKEGRSSI